MLKLSVGYQYPDEYSEERFPEILQDYSDSIAELYFAPGNEPGARSPAAKASGLEENEAWEILTEDIVKTRKMGIKLNLLFNIRFKLGNRNSYLLHRISVTNGHATVGLGVEVVGNTEGSADLIFVDHFHTAGGGIDRDEFTFGQFALFHKFAVASGGIAPVDSGETAEQLLIKTLQ